MSKPTTATKPTAPQFATGEALQAVIRALGNSLAACTSMAQLDYTWRTGVDKVVPIEHHAPLAAIATATEARLKATI